MEAVSNPDLRAGINLYLQQDYAGAEKELLAATRIQPTWAEGLSYLGFAQYMQKNYSDAAGNLEKAVLLDPENPESRFGLGLVWAAMGKVDPAIACWDETLRTSPGHAGAKQSLVGGLVYRAQKYIDDKDYDRAEHDLDRAIKIDRQSPQAPCMLANHFEAIGMVPRAEKVIAEALGYLPDDPHIQAFAAKLGVTANTKAVAQAQDMQARAAVQKSQEVPCPTCKRMVMEWTVICPHCSAQIKNMPGTFAGRMDALPVVTWQQVMYYIMTVIWMLLGAAPALLLGFAIMKVGGSQLGGIAMIPFVFGGAKMLLGIGMLFKNDFCMTFAKWISTIAILRNLLWIMMDYYGKAYLAAGLDIFAIAVDGFMIYLLNYEGCD